MSGGPGPIHLCALHGFTGAGSDFDRLAELSPPAWRWTTPDLPGHEGMANSDDESSCSVVDHQNHIREVWRESCREGERNVLLGYSMGGRAALCTLLAGTLSPTPDALVLVSVNPGIREPAERAKRRASDEVLARKIERQGLSWFLNYWQSLPIIQTQRNIPEPHRGRMAERRNRHSPTGLAASLRQFGQGVSPDCWSLLPGLPRPTIWFAGALDARYVEFTERVAKLAAGEPFILPNAGHAPHLEHPEAFSHHLMHWLKQA